MADMVSAYLRKGQLAFARRCRTGRAFEVYRKKFNNDQWHAVSFKFIQPDSLTGAHSCNSSIAGRINFYSQLLISIIRVAEINNSNYLAGKTVDCLYVIL